MRDYARSIDVSWDLEPFLADTRTFESIKQFFSTLDCIMLGNKTYQYALGGFRGFKHRCGSTNRALAVLKFSFGIDEPWEAAWLYE